MKGLITCITIAFVFLMALDNASPKPETIPQTSIELVRYPLLPTYHRWCLKRNTVRLKRNNRFDFDRDNFLTETCIPGERSGVILKPIIRRGRLQYRFRNRNHFQPIPAAAPAVARLNYTARLGPAIQKVNVQGYKQCRERCWGVRPKYVYVYHTINKFSPRGYYSVCGNYWQLRCHCWPWYQTCGSKGSYCGLSWHTKSCCVTQFKREVVLVYAKVNRNTRKCIPVTIIVPKSCCCGVPHYLKISHKPQNLLGKSAGPAAAASTDTDVELPATPTPTTDVPPSEEESTTTPT